MNAQALFTHPTLRTAAAVACGVTALLLAPAHATLAAVAAGVALVLLCSGVHSAWLAGYRRANDGYQRFMSCPSSRVGLVQGRGSLQSHDEHWHEAVLN